MSQDPSENLYCYIHPQRETLLRCNQCDRPICTACAVHTPTGYRCKECVRGQQRIFDTSQWWDYPLIVLTSGVLSWLGSLIANSLLFFILLLAPVAGMIIAEAVRRVINKRRSKWMALVAAISTLVGASLSSIRMLIFIILSSISTGQTGNMLLMLVSMIWPFAFALLAAGTVYYRLKGIRL